MLINFVCKYPPEGKMIKGAVKMKKIKVRWLLFLVAGLILILSACGGGSKNIAIGPPASETNNVSKLILRSLRY